MWIKSLRLQNVRGYEEQTLVFEKGIHFFYGDNGSGKTNVLEAISLLPLVKSFRTSEEKEMIRFLTDYARIDAVIQKQTEEMLRIILMKEGKRIELNQQEIRRLSELSGIVSVVSFLPEEVHLFKDQPSQRRRLMDIHLSMVSKSYLVNLSKYRLLLKQRNTLLKTAEDRSIHCIVLEEQMIDAQWELLKMRQTFVQRLKPEITRYYQILSGKQQDIELLYLTALPEERTITSFKEKMLILYQEHWDKDKKRKTTEMGIHRDDIELRIEEKSIATYGSQGQNRSAVLALKFALKSYIEQETKEEPILLLDDVLSELDEEHQKKLFECIAPMEQVFLTGTHCPTNSPHFYGYEVKNHTVRRV